MSLESTWPQKLELATWAAGQALFICVELKPYTEGGEDLGTPPETPRACHPRTSSPSVPGTGLPVGFP